MTNMNEMAAAIAKDEGGKQNLSIGQIKEVLRITLRILKRMSVSDLIALLNRVR